VSDLVALSPDVDAARAGIRWGHLAKVSAWAFLIAFWVALLIHGSGHDARVFHEAWRQPGGLYATSWHAAGYMFSPAFAQITLPLTLLPFPVYYAVITAASVGAVAWGVGPRIGAIVLLLPPVSAELTAGNINILLGGAIARSACDIRRAGRSCCSPKSLRASGWPPRSSPSRPSPSSVPR